MTVDPSSSAAVGMLPVGDDECTERLAWSVASRARSNVSVTVAASPTTESTLGGATTTGAAGVGEGMSGDRFDGDAGVLIDQSRTTRSFGIAEPHHGVRGQRAFGDGQCHDRAVGNPLLSHSDMYLRTRIRRHRI